MGAVWKTVLTVAMIFLITATGAMITMANLDITTAENYMEELALVIKESNYSQAVVEQCKKDAEENDYMLEVELYADPEHISSRYARVCLRYQYRLPLLQIGEWKSLERII